MSDRVVAVHEARKGLKRLRALLQLLRKGLPDEVYTRESVRLRDAARLLSPTRDRDATATLIASFDWAAHGLSGEQVETIGKAMLAESAANASDDDQSAAALRLIRQSKRALGRVKLARDEIDVIFASLETSFRHCRRMYAKAYKTGVAQDFHDWRKTVQRHWRHHALLVRGWPDYGQARIALAKSIAELLGEDQDLSLLLARLDTLADPPPEEALARKVRDAIEARQAELRGRALPLGAILTAEGASGHARRMAAYWSAARAARKAEASK
jgi:hypothetical protein